MKVQEIIAHCFTVSHHP